MAVASDKVCSDALAIYDKRWGEIESLFSCLKVRGFNLDVTRVTDCSRIKRLLVVPVIAFCWAHHRTCEWLHENIKPIKIKKTPAPGKSYNKYWLDWLRDNLLKSAVAFSSALQLFFQAINNIQLVHKV